MSEVVELFRCEPYRARMTPRACGRRYRRSRRRGDFHEANMEVGAHCKGCEIGRAHAAGQRPDVELVEVLARVSPRPAPRVKRSRAAVKPTPSPTAPAPVTVRKRGPGGIRGASDKPAGERLTIAPRTCACGATYTPTGTKQVYCARTCEARPRKLVTRTFGKRVCTSCGCIYTATSSRQERCPEHMERASAARVAT